MASTGMIASDHSIFTRTGALSATVPTYRSRAPVQYATELRQIVAEFHPKQLILFNISRVTKALRVKILSMKVLHNF